MSQEDANCMMSNVAMVYSSRSAAAAGVAMASTDGTALMAACEEENDDQVRHLLSVGHFIRFVFPIL